MNRASSTQLVECVPNFSEGRRPEIVDQIIAAIKTAKVTILGRQMDAAHNRAVVTFVGTPDSSLEAAFQGAKRASELIDLTSHEGEHPRIGAMDVCPLVPLVGISLEECAKLARRLARRISEELLIPTYLYEAAASIPERQNLANIRRGEFEGLRELIRTDPNRKPDFGPCEVHKTAGATAVGARAFLIAYNVNLTTDDVQIANKIAQAVRHKDGGLRYCKALGFKIKEKNCAQVSLNMTDFSKTGLHRALELIKREAARYGVGIKESEIVGLVPRQALVDAAAWYLQIDNLDNQLILENALEREGVDLN